MKSNFIFSCVVDREYKFQLQSQYWVITLINLGQISPDNIVIHTISGLDPALDAAFRDLGINLCPIDEYPGHAYCNKLQQIDSLLNKFESKYFVLMDCDMAISQSISSLPKPAYISAKRVDTANPPTNVLSRLFDAAGLGEPRWVNADFLPGRDGILTDINNCNGGIYIIERNFLRRLSPIWKKWANWCIGHEDLFEQYVAHIDQVSLAMAMKELSIDVELLNSTYNMPTHLAIDAKNDTDAHIIHYHSMFDDQLFLMKTGLSKLDLAISRVNECIRQSRCHLFLNSIFFGARYQLFPQLGSGISSRGNYLSYKQNLLKTLINEPQRSVLEVGFGDLQVSCCLPNVDYLGVETNSACIDRAKMLRPDWKYVVGDICKMQLDPRDIVICLDVLIHQQTYEQYLQLAQKLCELAVDTIVIGAYDCEPAFTSSITFYYEPITVTLRKLYNFTELSVVGKYRDISVIVARKRPSLSHKRDLSPQDFNIMSVVTDYPLLLRAVVDKSRDVFGFFASHTPRCLEYPWILSCLPDEMGGMNVLDVGAGVNPVPLMLTERGANVFTVDNHRLIRDLSQKQNLNERGYLDYSTINSHIHSINVAYETFSAGINFDVIYSLSVIEHLTANTRRIWIDKFARDMKKGAKLLLTVDLIPETNLLWYFSEGKVVENEEIHGTLEHLKDELVCAGFIIDECRIKRNLKNCRVDIGFICARLGDLSSLPGSLGQFDVNRTNDYINRESESYDLKKYIEDTNTRISNLQNEREETRARLILVEKNNVEITSSLSWQVTRPLRYLGGMLPVKIRFLAYQLIRTLWRIVNFSWLKRSH